MPRLVQVRNVPDDVLEVLRERARRGGMSLSAYLQRELERIASRPTMDDVLDEAELEATGAFSFEDVNRIVRRDRESR